MAGTSPTQNTIKYCKSQGLLATVTEHWNSFARIRQDLFGIIDVVAIGDCIHGIQTTTKANISARFKKILASEPAKVWLQSGGKLTIHGWYKDKNRWQVQIKEVTISDFDVAGD